MAPGNKVVSGSFSVHGETPCGVLRVLSDKSGPFSCTVPADETEGFHSFALAALARYTVPTIKLDMAMRTGHRNAIDFSPYRRV